MGIIELQVPMHSDKCERRVRRALAFLPGVDTVDIDRQLQKVTITGPVDAKRVLKRLRRTGKPIELWPQHQYDPKLAAYADVEYSFSEEFTGYDHDYGFEQKYKPLHDNKVTTMFSEDNPHNCSIM